MFRLRDGPGETSTAGRPRKAPRSWAMEARSARQDRKQEQRQALWAVMAKPEFDRAGFEARLAARFDQRRDFFVEFAESLHGYLATLSPEQRAGFVEMAEERSFMRKLFFKRANKDRASE